MAFQIVFPTSPASFIKTLFCSRIVCTQAFFGTSGAKYALFETNSMVFTKKSRYFNTLLSSHNKYILAPKAA